MKEDKASFEKVREFWNSRAGLGQWAGSRDVIAKQLEIETIASYVRDGMTILEIGCGNGITAIELARRFEVKITAFDYAEEMITSARELASGADCRGTIDFEVGDVLSIPEYGNKFDLIYTERVLINLPDFHAQKKAISAITGLLAENGKYVMCENSQDGLNTLNNLRKNVGLVEITPPWHNRYFNDSDIARIEISGVELNHVNNYSSTYYFLSRVINAWLSAKDGREPEYDSELNRLALQLPSTGDCGQGRIWLWSKK